MSSDTQVTRTDTHHLINFHFRSQIWYHTKTKGVLRVPYRIWHPLQVLALRNLPTWLATPGTSELGFQIGKQHKLIMILYLSATIIAGHKRQNYFYIFAATAYPQKHLRVQSLRTCNQTMSHIDDCTLPCQQGWQWDVPQVQVLDLLGSTCMHARRLNWSYYKSWDRVGTQPGKPFFQPIGSCTAGTDSLIGQALEIFNFCQKTGSASFTGSGGHGCDCYNPLYQSKNASFQM